MKGSLQRNGYQPSLPRRFFTYRHRTPPVVKLAFAWPISTVRESNLDAFQFVRIEDPHIHANLIGGRVHFLKGIGQHKMGRSSTVLARVYFRSRRLLISPNKPEGRSSRVDFRRREISPSGADFATQTAATVMNKSGLLFDSDAYSNYRSFFSPIVLQLSF